MNTYINSEVNSEWQVAEPGMNYWDRNEFLFQEETREIIGICMEVHNELGNGFLEIVYKDALEYEFQKRSIPYEREKEFRIKYKDIILRRAFNCDYLVFDKIILEVKAQSGFNESNYAQVVNYLASSGCTVALLVNFGEASLRFKRFAFTPPNKNKYPNTK